MRIPAGSIGANRIGVLSSLALSIASFLIVFFGGIFLAAQPRSTHGLIKLIPAARRQLVAEAMEESDRALRLWLKGQLWAMIVIFLMTWPACGCSACLGARARAHFRSSRVHPLCRRDHLLDPGDHGGDGAETRARAVGRRPLRRRPPCRGLSDPAASSSNLRSTSRRSSRSSRLLAFGLLFGFLGILFAAPLAVVSYVLVKRLYVIEALDTPTPIPGEDKVDQTSRTV